MAHHHFTREDRVILVKLKLSGLNNRSCARILGFHPSTIGRELKRGYAQTSINYSLRVANNYSKTVRHSANQQHRKLHKIQAKQIVNLLEQYYSPDQAGKAVGLSHTTVYRWLWSQSKAFLKNIWKFLRHKKIRRKYGTKRRERQRELQKKRWINQRPQTINDRLFFGHWEGDTVRGHKR